MIKDWLLTAANTIPVFLKDWILKYGFVNIGWLAGFVIGWWFVGAKIFAGVCAGIFIEKNRKQLALAFKDVKEKYLQKKETTN